MNRETNMRVNFSKFGAFAAIIALLMSNVNFAAAKVNNFANVSESEIVENLNVVKVVEDSRWSNYSVNIAPASICATNFGQVIDFLQGGKINLNQTADCLTGGQNLKVLTVNASDSLAVRDLAIASSVFVTTSKPIYKSIELNPFSEQTLPISPVLPSGFSIAAGLLLFFVPKSKWNIAAKALKINLSLNFYGLKIMRC